MVNQLIIELQELADKERAKILQKFFKTNKGEYGEGDIFLGIRVPIQRDIAKKYIGLDLYKLQELINSEIHEHRQVCLIILIEKYKNSDEEGKGNIFNFYLKNLKNINNWDLVDISAPHIIGNFLKDKKKNVLYELVKSKNLWERRVAIVSTFEFIRKEDFVDTLAISELLLKDEHDLIHKAVGWMLREVGKKDIRILEEFLKEHYKNMPRTMLRYAIEKFDEEQRKKYLRGEI
jgi:3-methyladenine DNA glycosylase AlkD